jgi:hypothetical protein
MEPTMQRETRLPGQNNGEKTNGAAQDDGFEIRKTPELFKFTERGRVISGRLMEFTREQAEGKQVPTYYIAIDDRIDAMVKIRATYDLLQKLRPQDVGCLVRIKFLGSDEANARQGQNAMQIFEVAVKKQGKREIITDADIGF